MMKLKRRKRSSEMRRRHAKFTHYRQFL